MMKLCQFCNEPMSPRNQSIYCGKCSNERKRLANIRFYGCEHPRPVRMTRKDRYAVGDMSPCAICGAVPPSREGE